MGSLKRWRHCYSLFTALWKRLQASCEVHLECPAAQHRFGSGPQMRAFVLVAILGEVITSLDRADFGFLSGTEDERRCNAEPQRMSERWLLGDNRSNHHG